MENTEKYVQEALFALQDPGYRDFHAKLIPTVNKADIIGVRTPQLRRFAKAFCKMPQKEQFLRSLPHRYYEENNLHGFLIEQIRDFDDCIAALNDFLPFVDNWATCDMMRPKIFAKHLPALLPQIDRWLHDAHPYTVRFGVEMLMCFYLDEAFQPQHLEKVAALRSEEYYVNMMIAWYFATALAKQYDAALPYIKEHRLAVWTHNKAIQKATESYRITQAQKALLRGMKQNKRD